MPNNEPTGGQPPSSRRDRREAARRDQRLSAAGSAAPKPAWQSPMVLLSVGAVAVGLVVVLLASGVLGRNVASTGDLRVPIRPTPPELIDPSNSRVVGPADAPVTIEVWSDFQCPACGFFARTIAPDLIEEFVRPGTVRIVYRDLAFIDGGDPAGESQQSAAAARCAGDQGTFWQYHDYLFENQKNENKGAFRREVLDSIATAVGLDMPAYRSCMDDGDAPEQATTAETAQGKAAGIGSTPTLVINGVLQKAGAIPMTDLRTLIAAELAKVSPAPGASGSPAPSASPAP
ncbi:MAG TPA: thioredoxin domain-containing protein [Candidatus Nanopelagicales bacterium]|nr:thioredoxin domain-containing protein [Candidatus Nanopelagicales bacterium]